MIVGIVVVGGVLAGTRQGLLSPLDLKGLAHSTVTGAIAQASKRIGTVIG